MSWIKVRTNLESDPRVVGMADRLGIPDGHVLGLLVITWSLADDHAVSRPCPGGDGTTTGHLSRYTPDRLDSRVRVEGFARAMEEAGWLIVTPEGLEFPDWDVHNGTSAKTRACEQKKKARQRAKSAPKGASASRPCPDATGTKSGLEKRREDLNTPLPPRKGQGEGVVVGAESQEASRPATRDTLDAIRSRPVTSSDRPDLHPIAQAIVRHYQDAVQTTWPPTIQATSAVVAVLASGLSADRLRQAIDRYADHCSRNDVPAQKRKSIAGFVHPEDGVYPAYLDAPQESTLKLRPAVIDLERRPPLRIRDTRRAAPMPIPGAQPPPRREEVPHAVDARAAQPDDPRPGLAGLDAAP